METTKKTKEGSKIKYNEDGIRRYGLVGAFILICLAVLAVLAFSLILVFDDGSTDPQLNAAFYGLVFICGLLAFGLLYVLFTLRGMLAYVRSETFVREPVRAVEAAPAPTLEYGRSSRDVEIIEGIGTVFSRRLEKHGIRTLQDLRQAPVVRIADAAQVAETVAYRWKTMAELMRIRELTAQEAELIAVSGIESVSSLAQQDPAALARHARTVNASQKHRVYPMPITVSDAERWVGAARAGARTA